MKKRVTPALAAKLVVRRETLRELKDAELKQAGGGDSNAGCGTGVVAPKPPNG